LQLSYLIKNMNAQWNWIFLWIILWVFIWPVFSIFIHRMRGKKGPYGRNDKTPLDILKERYAKGDIDKAMFDEMKKDL
jgi:putative membrane protein